MRNISDNPKLIYFISILLLFPSLFINLGLMPLIEDASIRALVAKEMILSHDYITPTMGGELYLKKPPFFNWMVATSMQVFNSGSEFVIRFPVVFTLLAFSLTIFIFFRKYVNNYVAFLSSFGFITCGRVLLYESQKGLIDITFSWLIFLIFMLIYHYGKKNKWLLLFLAVWGITTITYFLKGLPALVFTGFTLLSYVIWRKHFLLLFSWKHILSFFIFLLFFFGYYLAYHNRNNFNLLELFGTLWTESTMRTPIENTTGETLLHFFTFPIEYIFHFLPWTLPLLLLLWRKNRQLIKQNNFLSYIILVFLANIWVYWISPEIFARYLLMFVPISNVIGLFILQKYAVNKPGFEKTIRIILFLIILITGIGAMVPAFTDVVDYIPYVTVKSLLISIALIGTSFILLKAKKYYLGWLVVALLMIRVGFNWFVLPFRYNESIDDVTKHDTYAFACATGSSKIFYYWPPAKDPADYYYRKRITSYKIMYYLTDAKNSIIQHNSDMDTNAIYLVHPKDQKFIKADTIGRLPDMDIRHQNLIMIPGNKVSP